MRRKYLHGSEFTMWRHFGIAAALLGMLTFTACSTNSVDNTSPPTSASQSKSTTAPQTSATTSPSAGERPTTTPIETVATIADEPVVSEPVVLECLQGTPGPARMSDGTMAFSQWCFDQLGGNQYLDSERRANTFDCDGTTCRNPNTGGTYPDPSAAKPPATTVKTATPAEAEQNQREAAESGCATSGCIQTYFGCRDGYITDDVCRRWGF